MKHFVYKTVRIETGEYYYGVHSTQDVDGDGYLGSGTRIKTLLKKHGKTIFEREIVEFTATREEAMRLEYETLRPCLKDPLCLNIVPGGWGSATIILGRTPAKGQRWVTNGVDDIMVRPGQVALYVLEGWRAGRTKVPNKGKKGFKKGYRWMRRGEEYTNVPPLKIDSYLAEGWVFGGRPSKLKGTKTGPMSPERRAIHHAGQAKRRGKPTKQRGRADSEQSRLAKAHSNRTKVAPQLRGRKRPPKVGAKISATWAAKKAARALSTTPQA